MRSEENFKHLLSKAVRTIALQENKNIQIVHDELGHALGRPSGSCIDYWRRGNLPADANDTLQLAKTLSKKNALTSADLKKFMQSAEPWLPQTELDEILAQQQPPASLVTSPLPRSPFIVGPPITNPADFYGRCYEVQRICNWWQNNPLQNVAIVGLKRSGKTSLLHFLQNSQKSPQPAAHTNHKQLALPNRYIFIDFQDPRMVRLGRLLRYILQQLNLPSPKNCSLEQFMDIIAFQIQYPTIIMMDELIAGLEAPELNETFWWSMRSLVSHFANGNLAFALTAHDVPMQLAENQGKASPFFNMFNTIQLGPLQVSEARALIARSPQPFPENDVAWILQESGCWPSLLQILCQARLDALLTKLPSNKKWQDEGLAQTARFAYLLA